MIKRIVALGALITVVACEAGTGERAPDVGALTPEYTAVALAGDSVSLADHEGEVVLLNVWATWCIPCREEIPALQRLHEKYSEQGLRIVGVSVDARGDEQAVKEFAESFGVTYDIWLDPGERVMSTFRVIGVPTSYLMDREGRVVWKDIGQVHDDDPALLALIQDAL